MIKIKKSYIVAGVVAAGAAVVGAYFVKKKIEEKRRKKRQIIPDDVRTLMFDLMKLEVEDYAPKTLQSGGLGKSQFIRTIEKMSDRQLMALFSIVQVGYFLKASGIDPFHASQEQIKQAARKFDSELASAPTNRAVLLGELDTTDVFDALKAAYSVLSRAEE